MKTIPALVFVSAVLLLSALLLGFTAASTALEVRGGGTPAQVPQDAAELPPAYQSQPWIYTGGPIGGLGYDVRMHPENPDLMYVTDAWAGVFMSQDGGTNWYPSNKGITDRVGPSGDGIPVFSLTIDPNNPDVVWAGTQYSSGIYRGVYSDTTGTVVWTQMNTGTNGITETKLSVRGFTIEPGDSDIVYFGAEVSSFEWNGEPLTGTGLDMTKGVVYKTTDGGETWNRIWYGDNLARYVWISPEDHDTLYVSTGIFDREAANSDVGTQDPGGVGILRSYDGGATWDVLDGDNGIDPLELAFGSLYMHPITRTILLAGSGNDPYSFVRGEALGGVYKTTDGGDNWTEVLDAGIISSVEICETAPDVMYAGGAMAFYRSEDGGDTWHQTQSGWWGPVSTVAGWPIDLQCDPRDPMRVFANNYGGGNFLTTDGGETWTVSSTGYTGALMSQVAGAQGNRSRVYATARSGFFASGDAGQRWSGIGNGVARLPEGIAIAVDPFDWQHILATTQEASGGIYSSHDGGQSWHGVDLWVGPPPNGEMATRLAFAPGVPQRVYATPLTVGCYLSFQCEAATGQGVLVSTDGGETWEPTGIVTGAVTGLAAAPQDNSLLYAGYASGEFFRSANGGESWELINGDILPPPSVPDPEHPPVLTSLAVDPFNSARVYAGFAVGAVAVSQDGGETWDHTALGMPPEAKVRTIVADPANPGVVYAGAEDSGVYVWTDEEGRWQTINDGLLTRAARSLALSADGTVLYLATEGGGVFRLGTPPVFPVYLPLVTRGE